MFDVYCKATGTPNPFGAGISAASPAPGGSTSPVGYEPAAGPFAPVPGGMGRVWLVDGAPRAST